MKGAPGRRTVLLACPVLKVLSQGGDYGHCAGALPRSGRTVRGRPGRALIATSFLIVLEVVDVRAQMLELRLVDPIDFDKLGQI